MHDMGGPSAPSLVQYRAFVLSMVLTSGLVMGGADGQSWEFPTSERWSLVTSRFGGAPKALRALLSGSPVGVEVRSEIRLLCAPAVCAQGRWVAAGTAVVAAPAWTTSCWRPCPDEICDVVSRCTGSFSDGTLRMSRSGVVCGFGVAWGAAGLSGCVS